MYPNIWTYMVSDIVLAKLSLLKKKLSKSLVLNFICSYVFSTDEFEKNKEIEKISHKR